MPVPLSVDAAMIPAIAVPWPFGSLRPSDPSRIDVPATSCPARSAWPPSTPVSRTATTDEPCGWTEPKAWSQPIFGSAHWSS